MPGKGQHSLRSDVDVVRPKAWYRSHVESKQTSEWLPSSYPLLTFKKAFLVFDALHQLVNLLILALLKVRLSADYATLFEYMLSFLLRHPPHRLACQREGQDGGHGRRDCRAGSLGLWGARDHDETCTDLGGVSAR